LNGVYSIFKALGNLFLYRVGPVQTIEKSLVLVRAYWLL